MLSWSRTGHVEVDRQHHDLFELIEQARGQIGRSSPDWTRFASLASLELRNTLSVFTDHAVAHFAYEESLMVRHEFPGAARHMASHRAIANGIIQLAEALDAGQSPERLLDEVLDSWLRHHVSNLDGELTQHVLACESAPLR